jgi:hypothetical protein
MRKDKLRLVEKEGGGEAPGLYELDHLSVQQAEQIARKMGLTDERFFDRFDVRFRFAQRMFAQGKTARKDMPVLNQGEVDDLQARLKDGYIDLTKPFAKTTNPNDRFPQGLHGKKANHFLDAGRRDGVKPDDKIPAKRVKIPAKQLVPIQGQVYFEKAIRMIINKNVLDNPNYFQEKVAVISGDNRIIDGHHRFLAAVLVDPNIVFNCLMLDLPLNTLLPLTLAYSDARGNARNEGKIPMKLMPILKEIKSKLLKENPLSRLYAQSSDPNDAVVIMTAFRGENDPKTNRQLNKQLASIFSNNRFGFTHVDGAYIENQGTPQEKQVREESLFVTSEADRSDELKKIAVRMMKKYRQDAIVFKPAGEKVAHLIEKDGSEFPIGNFHPNRASEFMTMLRGRQGSFTFSDE